MRRTLSLIVLVLMLIGSNFAAVMAQDATPGIAEDSLLSGLGYPEIRVTSDGTTHDFPAELEAGRYHVVLDNQSETEVDLEFIQLPEGVTIDAFTSFMEEAEQAEAFTLPDYFYDMVFNGGPVAFPGETSGVVLDLTPGEWVVNHVTFDMETEVPTNSPMTVTVTGEMPDVENPSGQVEIALIEMDFKVPDSFEAGPQLWHVSNQGLQIHHLVLSRVPEGTTEDQMAELAASFMGPPPAADATPDPMALSFEDVEDVFYTLLFSNNQFNLYEIDLESGTYALVCYMPDPSGTPHVMLGMIEIITVN